MNTKRQFCLWLSAWTTTAILLPAPLAIAAPDQVIRGSARISATKPARVTLDLGGGVKVQAGLTARAGVLLGGVRRGLVVDRLWVQRGSKALEVPLSAYADIYDPHTFTISVHGKRIEVEVDGSDGADGYRVLIALDGQGAVERTLFIVGGEVAEHTTYHRVVVD